MAISRLIKLSAGWQERLAAMAGGAPLVNGVNVTLSDGRTLSNVKVFDGATLELDKELSMSGVVITDMTPGVPVQADDPSLNGTRKANVYPTTSPAQQARQDGVNEKMKEGQNAAYTDASVARPGSGQALVDYLQGKTKSPFATALSALIAALEGFSRESLLSNTSTASVSPSQPTDSNPEIMNLSDLKQSLASVKGVEDLPTVVANVGLFADAIAKASEEAVAKRAAAETALKTTQASLEEVQAQLASIKKTHEEMVASQALAAAQLAYQERMTVVSNTFDLDDEVRAEIVDEVKACATDESFAKWLASAKKKMKGFMKKGDKKDAKKDAEPDEDDAKAALAAQTALASAKNNIVDPPINNSLDVNEQSLIASYKEAFAGGISIGGVSIKDLSAKKK